MKELLQDNHGRPLIFVRLNPDGYEQNGVKVKPVFKKVRTVMERDEAEFKIRFAMLKMAVAEAVASAPVEKVTAVQLCFDD